ncbi:hypothetical protein KM918_18540 [Priestia megaterium]|uniref:hypothetical protein n=1 Tax=Priestia megaterium TaxID=1404 RepID=UPI001C250773|nr:hypothetical protein [Priestia megaterium]MBU8689317.1 hypothetical protein [Priestia megaterium]
MIGGQDEDSCGKNETGETPQERKRRGGSAPAKSEVLHGNQQRYDKQSIIDCLSHLFAFRLERFSYASTAFFYKLIAVSSAFSYNRCSLAHKSREAPYIYPLSSIILCSNPAKRIF